MVLIRIIKSLIGEKKMKKFVTSLLAMVMLLSLCTGCGGQKDSSSTGDTASAGTPSA